MVVSLSELGLRLIGHLHRAYACKHNGWMKHTEHQIGSVYISLMNCTPSSQQIQQNLAFCLQMLSNKQTFTVTDGQETLRAALDAVLIP